MDQPLIIKVRQILQKPIHTVGKYRIAVLFFCFSPSLQLREEKTITLISRKKIKNNTKTINKYTDSVFCKKKKTNYTRGLQLKVK